MFALGSAQGGVRLLDLQSGLVRRLRGRNDAAVDFMTFTPDRRTVVSSGSDGSIVAWDVERGELRETFSGHSEGSPDLGVSPDGRTLYTANGPSNDVSVVDVSRRAVTRKIPVGKSPWGVALGKAS